MISHLIKKTFGEAIKSLSNQQLGNELHQPIILKNLFFS